MATKHYNTDEATAISSTGQDQQYWVPPKSDGGYLIRESS